MPYQINEINHCIETDVKGFLEECDAKFQKKIAQAADYILSRRKESPIVLLSGPSGSGKTTTAMKIEEELERRGAHSHTISLDNYFVTINPKTAPRTPDGAIDYESPRCLDMDLLSQHFTQLSRGEEVIVPRFEFARQMRDTSRGTRLQLGKSEIAIFEGIHALNDDLTSRHPEAVRFYLSARSNVMDGDKLRFKGTWMRLSRRAVRDYNFRGSSVEMTMDMWANVRRGEKLYISPFKNKAHIKFDSSIPYEVSVMRHYASPLFEAIPDENPRRKELLDLVDAFHQFAPIAPELVAGDSLIREFIGGGIYEY
ncbi:MAG: adenylyl-sulfate kinase [Oscillospiraceae bacterium]|nr:adenylyl-sulfate kinase [Oscillospiraceae bacterium]